MFSSLIKPSKTKEPTGTPRFSDDEIKAAERTTWWLVFLALTRRTLQPIANLSQHPAPETATQIDQPSLADILPGWDQPTTTDSDSPQADPDLETSALTATDTTQISDPTRIFDHHQAAEENDLLPDLDPEVDPATGLTAAALADPENPVS